MQSSNYQVIVVGGGHAGCEAALASARAGAKTILFTINIDMVAAMPCNPSIGGQGKGQLVREIDALGGEMGKAADETRIQARRLNTRKGFAVQANRFQSDKEAYSLRMLKAVQQQENLCLMQGMVTKLLVENSIVVGVEVLGGEKFLSDTVILTTGTFLRGMIHIGSTSFPAGRAGEPPSDELGRSLEELGLPMARFKTGTPPRVDANTINFDNLEEQEDDPLTPMFSTWSDPIVHLPFKSCYITRTNESTHNVITSNIHRSALVAGYITGTGPRYCPSIEDKISKFPDKMSHKLFLEPEGSETFEYYLQGLSTSLPEEVQEDYVRTIPGLENARITRPGYGIEYDIVDPQDLFPTMMSKSIKNLFLAGQINGTSGYEEAAAQGILAGINAAATVRGDSLLILRPEDSYLGLMISEITTQGITEPYRVFTSRSPFRLQLRMSNAEERLSKVGFEYGVISQEQFVILSKRLEQVDSLVEKFEEISLVPAKVMEAFPGKIEKLPNTGLSLSQLLKRPDLELKDFVHLIPELAELDRLASMELEARIKYSGYLIQQAKEFDLVSELAEMKLDESFYKNIPKAVSTEARMKILAAKPTTVGDLTKLPGVRASDVIVIVMTLKKAARK